jgi:glycosyltransferase involved in cell wall biosynthesis
MKVFIGFENISSTVTDITNAFKEAGHSCYTAINDQPSVVELNTADFVLHKEFNKMPIIKPKFIGIRLRSWWERRVRKKFFEKCLSECDVFIFLWSTFYYDYSDLAILKQRKKKIVFVFAGDDVRWRPAASQEYKSFDLEEIPREDENLYSQKHLIKNLTRIRYAEKYADIIFSRLDQGQLQLRPYYRWNMMAEPHQYEYKPEQRKTNPIILHAPTSKAIKGTAYILEAFEQLKKEGIEFTPVLVEKTAHEEALKVYANADIIIDQLILPGTGKLASEALSMGKVVVARMGYKTYPQKTPKDCPIVDADIHSIYNILRDLINDWEKRQGLAKRGRAYVEQYLRPKYFCETVENLIEDKKKVEPEYHPNFFRENFIPENENIETYNKWTTFVKEEKWYDDIIKPGERAGLIF